jgi:hypothetical protein
MPARRTTAGSGLRALLLTGPLALAGCTDGSARHDYFASRAVTHTAQSGDGSVVSLAPGGPDASWTASLTFVPLAGAGDLADTR